MMLDWMREHDATRAELARVGGVSPMAVKNWLDEDHYPRRALPRLIAAGIVKVPDGEATPVGEGNTGRGSVRRLSSLEREGLSLARDLRALVSDLRLWLREEPLPPLEQSDAEDS